MLVSCNIENQNLTSTYTSQTGYSTKVIVYLKSYILLSRLSHSYVFAPQLHVILLTTKDYPCVFPCLKRPFTYINLHQILKHLGILLPGFETA
jgi:hypothetical protein